MITSQDIKLLDFEELYPRHTGIKSDLILHRLGMTTARYYQRLTWLCRQHDVERLYPQLAHRVRTRSERMRARREAMLRML